MTGSGASAGAAMLRGLRQRRGLSWSEEARGLREVARDLGLTQVSRMTVASIQRNVARWERVTEPTRPGERYQLLLARFYARTPIGTTAVGPGSDFAALMEAFAQFGIAEDRIEELRNLIVTALTRDDSGLLALLTRRDRLTSALSDPDHVDDDVLTDLRAAVTEVDRAVGAVPFVRLQLMLAPLVEICRRLSPDAVPEPVRSRLLGVAADAYMLAGRLAFETRDDDASASLYAAAVETAGRLADRWHRAAIRTSQTMVVFYSTADVEAARRVADAAVRDAQDGGSALVRARAYALRAELAARAGHGKHAAATLRLAWHHLGEDKNDDPAPSAFDAGRLRGFEGVCQLYTGKATQAHTELEHSASGLTAVRERVQRGIVSTDLALARLRMGEARDAAALLHDCIDLTAAAGGRVPAQRIRQARLALRPWRTEPFVADLDEHIHAAPLSG